MNKMLGCWVSISPFLSSYSAHTALEAGSDEEQRSHGSSYKFVRAYEFVLPECTYSSTQICLNFDSGRIRTPLFLRNLMRV